MRKALDWATWGHLLGIIPDMELADKLGTDRATVCQRRIKLGIPYAGKPAPIDWDRVPLGEFPDCVLAKRLGCCKQFVTEARKERGLLTPHQRNQRDNRQTLAKLAFGTKPDYQLAWENGFSQSTICTARNKRGIPVYGGKADHSPKGIKWDKQPLGLMPDRNLAGRLSVDVRSVVLQRQKRGIPKYVAVQQELAA